MSDDATVDFSTTQFGTTQLLTPQKVVKEIKPVNPAESRLYSILQADFDHEPSYLSARGEVYTTWQAVRAFVVLFFTFNFKEAFRVFNKDPIITSRAVQLIACEAANSPSRMGKDEQQELFRRVNKVAYEKVLAQAEIPKEERFKYLISPTLWGENWELYEINNTKHELLKFLYNNALQYDAIEPESGLSYGQLLKNIIQEYDKIADQFIFGLMEPSETSLSPFELHEKESELFVRAQDIYNDIPMTTDFLAEVDEFQKDKKKFLDEMKPAITKLKKILIPLCPKRKLVFLSPLFSKVEMLGGDLGKVIRDEGTLHQFESRLAKEMEHFEVDFRENLPKLEAVFEKIRTEGRRQIQEFLPLVTEAMRVPFAELEDQWIKNMLAFQANEEMTLSIFVSRLENNFERQAKVIENGKKALALLDDWIHTRKITEHVAGYLQQLNALTMKLKKEDEKQQQIFQLKQKLLQNSLRAVYDHKTKDMLFQEILDGLYLGRFDLEKSKVIQLFAPLDEIITRVRDFLSQQAAEGTGKS